MTCDDCVAMSELADEIENPIRRSEAHHTPSELSPDRRASNTLKRHRPFVLEVWALVATDVHN